MQTELHPDTQLFAGRYTITGTANVTPYGFTYTAYDQSSGSKVFVQEFFPHKGCHRNAETLDMAIRREDAPLVSAMYRKFTQYVTRLKDNTLSGAQPLIHAFKDHGTAYYVTADDDSQNLAGLNTSEAEPAQAQTRIAASTLPSHTRPEHAARINRPASHDTDPRAQRTPAEATYRNAILWYRIVIFLLVCIVLLLVYLTFLSPSPKVKSAHTAQPATVENVVDSIAAE